MSLQSLKSLKLATAARCLVKVGNSSWRLLRAQPAARWAQGVEVGAVVVLAGVSAQLVWSLMGSPAWPAGPVQGPAAAQKSRVAWQSGVLTSVDPFHSGVAGDPTTQAARAPETMLNLGLFGIRAGANGGSAIIAGEDKVQKFFAVGEEIMPGVRLEAVFPDRVSIRRNGVAESLSLDARRDGNGAPAAMVVAAVPVSAQAVAAAEGRIRGTAQTFLTSVRVRPRAGGGLILESAASGILEQTGLAAGDIIVAVNGVPVNDAAAVMSMAATLAGADRVALDIERNGQSKVHRIAVER